MTAVAGTLGSRAVTQGRRFYVNMAVACLAIGLIGFLPTYWLPLVRGTLSVPPITHVHALFFYGWLLFVVFQASLIASGQVARHRETGVAGVALASGMCFVGLAVAISSMKHGDAAGIGAAVRTFSIVPLSGIVLFAVLIAIAIANVRRPEIHRRVMFVATASLLQAAMGRLLALALAPPGAVGPPPLAVTVAPGIAVDLLIVGGMLYDRRTTGRVHPAYWLAGGAVLAVQLLRVPIGPTAAWSSVAAWVLSFSP